MPIVQPQLVAPATNPNLPIPTISPLGDLPRSPSQFPTFSEHMANDPETELDIEAREAAPPRKGATNDIRNILPMGSLGIVANQPSNTMSVLNGMNQNDFKRSVKGEERRASPATTSLWL